MAGPTGPTRPPAYCAAATVGQSGKRAGVTATSYWTDDRRLHQMGSVVPGMWQSLALGVSEGGWAAGQVDLEVAEDEDSRRAFVWTGSGNLLMLPGLDGAWDSSTGSNAHGVDDLRDKVAGKLRVDGLMRPAVWRCASTIGVDPT